MAHKMKVTGKKYYIKTREKQRKNKKNKVKSTKNGKFIH